MRPTIVMAAAAIVGAAMLLSVPRAGADIGPPQPGSPCAENLAGALTQLSDGDFLLCSDGSWESFTGPYPSSDRWLSYGPTLTLHGQGFRNPEILSGKWIATPQQSDSTCSAEQAAVIGAGEVGPPQTSTGERGQPLEFDVVRVVFSIKLTGDCLWERVS